MIPCRSSCPHYAEGCHKTCTYWKNYQRELQDQQRKKMQWLKAQNEVCTTVLRQYLAMSTVRPVYY